MAYNCNIKKTRHPVLGRITLAERDAATVMDVEKWCESNDPEKISNNLNASIITVHSGLRFNKKRRWLFWNIDRFRVEDIEALTPPQIWGLVLEISALETWRISENGVKKKVPMTGGSGLAGNMPKP